MNSPKGFNHHFIRNRLEITLLKFKGKGEAVWGKRCMPKCILWFGIKYKVPTIYKLFQNYHENIKIKKNNLVADENGLKAIL